jgi:hypothetical protein
MKRRSRKRELRALELGFGLLISRFFRLSKRAHKDVVYKFENKIEAAILRMLDIHLKLDSSWPTNERWLDSIEEISWSRENASLIGQGILWYGLVKGVGSGQFSVPVKIKIRLSSHGVFEYAISLGEVEERRIFANRIKAPKNSMSAPL